MVAFRKGNPLISGKFQVGEIFTYCPGDSFQSAGWWNIISFGQNGRYGYITSSFPGPEKWPILDAEVINASVVLASASGPTSPTVAPASPAPLSAPKAAESAKKQEVEGLARLHPFLTFKKNGTNIPAKNTWPCRKFQRSGVTFFSQTPFCPDWWFKVILGDFCFPKLPLIPSPLGE